MALDRSFAGFGAAIRDGARLEVSRTVFEENFGAGVFVYGDDALFRATDVVVAGTHTGGVDERHGWGVVALAGSRAEITRGAFERNHGAGLLAWGGDVAATDVVLRDTEVPANASGEGGLGALVLAGSTMVLERAHVARNAGGGLVAVGALTGRDVRIDDTTLALQPGDEGPVALADGLQVVRGGSATLERLRVSAERRGR